jgi:uncharacterized protein
LPAPRPWTDAQLYLLLAATVATGVALWWYLPPGYAWPIASEPWRLFALLLLYPVVEEWLFRGLLQGELLSRRWGAVRHLGFSRANLLTSTAFALVHLVNQPWTWVLAVFAPSLALGHFRERYGGIRMPVLLHIAFNLTYVLAGLRG